MLSPHGADFVGAGQLAAGDFGFGLGEICLFRRRQLERWLIDPGKLKQGPRQFVLL